MPRVTRAVFSLAILIHIGIPSSTVGASEYTIGPQDRVRVRVQEWPDLNGEYSVSPEGNISLPIVGHLRAAGRSISGLGEDISAALQQRSGAQPIVRAAVEISQFRPFFVLGDVQRPGEYLYRPGLTVLQAIAMAGGYFRPNDPGLLRLERDIIQAEGERSELERRQLRVKARAARLAAERSGQETISFPEALSQSEDRSITETEVRVFTANRDHLRRERAHYEATKALYTQEVDSLGMQMETLKRQESVVQKQLGQLRELSGRGLALESRQLDLERITSQIAGERLALQSAKLRAVQSIATAEQRLHDQLADRQRVLLREEQDTLDERDRIAARLQVMKALAREAAVTAPALARTRAAMPNASRSLSLVRGREPNATSLEVQDHTLIGPGDVLNVDYLNIDNRAQRPGL